MTDPSAETSVTAYQEIGGLIAKVSDGRIAHWNTDIPGMWVKPHTLATVGSYVSSFCEPLPGVYRLIALDDNGDAATLDRMCDRDKTGTLYIGKESKTFSDRSRLGKLIRSLRPPRSSGVFNDEHKAGYRLRRHPTLSQRFPESKLAIAWCYTDDPTNAEGVLFDTYFASFGDLPPLNRRSNSN
jgi:hypothetical protein